jgi:hypothetical protein
MPRIFLYCLVLVFLLNTACEETGRPDSAKNTRSKAIPSTKKSNSSNKLAEPSPEEVVGGHLNLPQDLIMDNLNEVIYKWSPEQEFALNTELKNIWVKGSQNLRRIFGNLRI